MLNVEESKCSIVKRNGMFVPFRRDSISRALEAAVRDAKSISSKDELPENLENTVSQVTQNVVKELLSDIAQGDTVTVERVQDIVGYQLHNMGMSDVAQNYLGYNCKHKSMERTSWSLLKIRRRDGSSVRFNPIKISSAIEKAFRATLDLKETNSTEVIETVNDLTHRIIQTIVDSELEKNSIDVETVQDLVEQILMVSGYYDVAKNYILYRQDRAQERKKQDVSLKNDKEIEDYGIMTAFGDTYRISKSDLVTKLSFISKRFPDTVNPELLAEMAFMNCYEGMKESELDAAYIMAARANVEKEPDYGYVAADLLMSVLYREVLGFDIDNLELEIKHKEYFKNYIHEGVAIGRLSPALLDFDLEFLSNALRLDRDKQFSYIGIQTLYDRYFIQNLDKRMETPQILWMRVAMGLSLNEGSEKNIRVIEFYNVMSSFLYMSATPTLFNSGTSHSQLSSCYLSTIEDDLKNIYKVISDNAMLSKWAGGIGNDWTNVRATGSIIKGTNGRSQGVIPFIKVGNDTAIAVNQGGKRKGAMCVYLEIWHLDSEDFMELRKNTGDDRRRTHDINTANWIPDLFFKRLLKNGQWTLFSPNDVPGLHSAYGKEFERLYEFYEKEADEGRITLFKRIEATALWRKMLSMVYETGHPWLTFKDPSNIRSPQDHVGVIHCSNLCTEIMLNTSKEETAVCNLGSINLPAHIQDGVINEALLAQTIRTAVRILDNVIDTNFYPIDEAYTANSRHRAVGLGIMGFQDALYKLNISYAEQAAVEFADQSMEMVSYYAILASSELAAARGTYATYEGSKWSKGLLPLDTLELLRRERGEEHIDIDMSYRKDWEVVRESVKQHGMRNSNVLAIAPTATISNIVGVTQSIEPTYKHLFVKSNLSGDFTIPNTFLIDKLKSIGLWDEEMVDDLKYFDGSLMEIERVPLDVKKLFLTAFEIDPEWIIECGARRQKWIDMAQSLNLYLAQPDGNKLAYMYLLAWQKGLKSTYYLRALGATSIEKSSTDINKRGIQPRWMKNKSASNEIVVKRVTEGPFVCSLEEACESCQ
ncbi:MAG: ribonucleoside-diphosphate reductase subunit alpha [Victivallaceae bacterium]